MLQAQGLTKRFGDVSVLQDFDLKVPENGFTVLIGPSGCGKSTLFNILAGVVAKDKGQIWWDGRPVSDMGRRVAYMQQKDLLLPWYTLMDNALLPCRIDGADMTAARAKARTLFQRLGLGGFEAYRPGQISGGMRQRCALVRTLMFEHDLVLLDEPLSALDAITRRSLQSLLLMLQTEFDRSILMITHDIEEALLLADEVLVVSRTPMRVLERFVLSDGKPRSINDPKLLEIKAYVLQRLEQELGV
jgi:ABC-type nitrate/sulfonate/bicarbonate transport system ATPase subunit